MRMHCCACRKPSYNACFRIVKFRDRICSGKVCREEFLANFTFFERLANEYISQKVINCRQVMFCRQLAVTEIFLLLYRHKTQIIFKKKSEEKSRSAENSNPGTALLQHTPVIILPPPKPLAQLLIFPTFQYLYTALELKPSSVETVFIHGSRVEIVPKPNPNLMASAALELKPSLTLTLWHSATYCQRRLEPSQCSLLLTPNQPFPVQPTANAGEIVKIFP